MNILNNGDKYIIPYLIVKNEKVNLEISINKTEKWGAKEDLIPKLIENCTTIFLTEFKSYNFPEGKIFIDHSSNFIRKKNCPSIEWRDPFNPVLNDRIIYLNTECVYWQKFFYQYLHEFCHYMFSSYSSNWFEESLCELSSIYFLRKMGYYSDGFLIYVIQTLNSFKKLDIPITEWYFQNKNILSNNKYERDLNSTVAKYYLPYFENNPFIWNILCYAPNGNIQNFDLFMKNWLNNCPGEYKKYINKFIKDFDLNI